MLHKEASIAEVVAQGGGHLYYYLDPKQASGAGWNDRAYLMPIPTEEMGMNENLKQNPGWE